MTEVGRKGWGDMTVLVLMGGPSAEREVSLVSGSAVAEALREGGYEVITSDIGPDNLSGLDKKGIDVVFPVLHGTFGEDGQLQEILQARGLAFVGCDAASSRLAMDKYRAKKAFAAAGVATPSSVLLETDLLELSQEDFARKVKQGLERVGLPCVIKPNLQGSSVGVSIVRDKQQGIAAVKDGLEKYGPSLLEQYIKGREFTVSILAGQVLPVLEIKPAEGFYDYQAKYIKNDTQYILDPELKDGQVESLQKAAWDVFCAVGCRDLARVDFMMDESCGVWALEVNTMPGFTSHSLLPKAARHAGMSMMEICDKIVRIARNRPM
jgi:D-alanine-D-alanine ligase